MKRILTLLVILLSLSAALPLAAQDDIQVIEFGETMTGEITNAQFEVPYSFTGASGDIILIELKADNWSMLWPSIILLDANMSVLATAENWDRAVLAVKLPADGRYTVLATRDDGRAGDSEGEYALTVFTPTVLALDEPVEGSLTNEEMNYYIVETTGSFKVFYEKTGGTFYPGISIERIGSDRTLEEVALMEGEGLVAGMLGMEAGSSFAATTYVVVVKQRLWDFNFDTVSAEYTLTLSQ